MLLIEPVPTKILPRRFLIFKKLEFLNIKTNVVLVVYQATKILL